MSNTLRIPKAHLTMALCLPLAVIVGYFLVDPLEPSSVAFVGFVLAVLTIPLMIKWHHPLLIICWNATLAPSFLPGQPPLWILLAGIGLGFGILNRSVDSNRRFVHAPSIRNSLFFLGLVVAVTAYFNGGLGFGFLGSSQFGGRRYFNIYAAIIGYFALTSQPVPIHRANLFTGLFFLSMLLTFVPNLAFFVGDSLNFVYYVFPSEYSNEQFNAAASGSDSGRMLGLTAISNGLFCFLLARYGIRGVFDPGNWWRLAVFCLAIVACLLAGFRTFLILFAILLVIQFYLEKLYLTRLLWIFAAVMLVGGGLVISQSQKLPFYVQRTLSFLPIEVNSDVKFSAESSLDWRLRMWKVLLPEVPKYLLKGKGFGIDPTAMYFSTDANRQQEGGIEWAIVAGDYHSGPLSLIIPLGIGGVLAFGWFLVASVLHLYRQHRSGPPALQRINTFLLSYFLARIILFLFFFGGFHSDLFIFTGIIGLSVSLNGATQEKAVEPSTQALEGEIEPCDYRDDYA